MTVARLDKLSASLPTSGLHAVALNPGPTLIYLTGAHFHLMERPVVFLVAAGQTPAIVLPELEMLKVEQMPYPVQAFPYGEDPSGWEKAFRSVAQALGLAGKRVGVEPGRMRPGPTGPGQISDRPQNAEESLPRCQRQRLRLGPSSAAQPHRRAAHQPA
jgi:Xaa-Pro dipeptidase